MDSTLVYTKTIAVLTTLITNVLSWYWAGYNYALDIDAGSDARVDHAHLKSEFYAIWATAGALCLVQTVAFAIAVNDGNRVVSRFIIGKKKLMKSKNLRIIYWWKVVLCSSRRHLHRQLYSISDRTWSVTCLPGAHGAQHCSCTFWSINASALAEYRVKFATNRCRDLSRTHRSFRNANELIKVEIINNIPIIYFSFCFDAFCLEIWRIYLIVFEWN